MSFVSIISFFLSSLKISNSTISNLLEKDLGSKSNVSVSPTKSNWLSNRITLSKFWNKNLVENIEFRKRFENEAQTHSKLDHLNIVRLIDYKEVNDGLFLIMEYVDGKQLDEHIKKVSGPIPEQELTALFSQILDAIGYAHDEGLIHRDIKLENFLAGSDINDIRLTDFGLAIRYNPSYLLIESCGTFTTVAPEVDTFCGYDYKVINASDERSSDSLLNKIDNACKGQNILNNKLQLVDVLKDKEYLSKLPKDTLGFKYYEFIYNFI